MPSLKEFARRIRRRARQIEEETNKATIQTAQAINQSVVLATPVDTGRARANWQVEIGAPARDVVVSVDPEGSRTVSVNNSRIGTRKPGRTIFISNNVDYIGDLNAGTSAQAPANFVQLSVMEAVNFLRRKRIIR